MKNAAARRRGHDLYSSYSTHEAVRVLDEW